MRKGTRTPGILAAGLIALLAVVTACDRKPSPGKAGETTKGTADRPKATSTGGGVVREVQTPRPTPSSPRPPAGARKRPERY